MNTTPNWNLACTGAGIPARAHPPVPTQRRLRGPALARNPQTLIQAITKGGPPKRPLVFAALHPIAIQPYHYSMHTPLRLGSYCVLHLLANADSTSMPLLGMATTNGKEASPIGDGRHGFEIVDKRTGKEVYLDGSWARNVPAAYSWTGRSTPRRRKRWKTRWSSMSAWPTHRSWCTNPVAGLDPPSNAAEFGVHH